MEIALLWLITSVLTRLSNKFKVSQTYLAIILSILLGAWYYVATNYYQVERQQLVERATWVYASSQIIYNLLKKRGLLDKLETTNELKQENISTSSDTNSKGLTKRTWKQSNVKG